MLRGSDPEARAMHPGKVSVPLSSGRPRGQSFQNPFRLLPQGPYALLPTTLCTLAWISSLVPEGCDFARLEGPAVDVMAGSATVPYAEVGRSGYRVPDLFDVGAGEDPRWAIVSSSPCIAYGNLGIDENWRFEFGRVCAFLAQMFGGLVTIVLWGSIGFTLPRRVWRFAAYAMLLAAFFVFLSFAWLETEVCHQRKESACSLRFGAKADIAAGSLWLVAAGAAFWRYPKPRPWPVPQYPYLEAAVCLGRRQSDLPPSILRY